MSSGETSELMRVDSANRTTPRVNLSVYRIHDGLQIRRFCPSGWRKHLHKLRFFAKRVMWFKAGRARAAYGGLTPNHARYWTPSSALAWPWRREGRELAGAA